MIPNIAKRLWETHNVEQFRKYKCNPIQRCLDHTCTISPGCEQRIGLDSIINWYRHWLSTCARSSAFTDWEHISILTRRWIIHQLSSRKRTITSIASPSTSCTSVKNHRNISCHVSLTRQSQLIFDPFDFLLKNNWYILTELSTCCVWGAVCKFII